MRQRLVATLRYLLLSVCFGIALTLRGALAQDLISFNVGAPPSDGVKALLYAANAGIFRKHGLDVNIVRMSNGSAALAAIPGGSIQVAFVNSLSIVNAYGRGLHFVIVAPGGIYQTERPYSLLFVLKNSPIQSGRDLNGSRVAALALGDMNATVIREWTDQNGGDSKTLRMMELPASSFLPAMDDGRVDMVMLTSPYMEQALASGKYRVLGKPLDVIGKRALISAWAAGSDAVVKNPDAYMRFGAAMREAVHYSNAHLADSVDLVAAYTKVDANVIAHGMRVLDAESIDARDVQPLIDIALKYGLIDKAFDPNAVIFASARKPGR